MEGQDKGGQEKERTLILHRKEDDGSKQESREEKGGHEECSLCPSSPLTP